MGPDASGTGRGYRNRLAEVLGRRGFALTVESPPLLGSKPLEEVLAEVVALARWLQQDGRVAAITVSDRVRTDRDHDPITVASRVAEATGAAPLVHWAGKGRTLAHLREDLERARAGGLQSFLFLTGDALREPPQEGPARYLDSVDALRTARRELPDSLLAAAVNPFKYREEALLGQYVKAAKKLRAGADVLITQIGWDPRKLGELTGWLGRRGLHPPVLAAVWLVTPRVAARLLQGAALPGVYVPGDLLRCLEAEAKAPDHGRQRAILRAALQVVGASRLGLAGAHLCGAHTPRTLQELLDAVERWERDCPDLRSWEAAWDEFMRHPDGRPVRLVPEDPFYLDAPPSEALASPAEIRRFRILEALDRWVFDHGSPLARAAGALAARTDPHGAAGRLLGRLEHVLKGSWLGCQMCGSCRLPHTFFVCPETCPKGLANGPCGGTEGNTCEFGDRECIHAGVYRLAKHTGRLLQWEATWVAPVPQEVRGTCSWVHHFRGHGAHAEALPEPQPASPPEPSRTLR
jgi:methylenetetrahydrofolate reductase (NADPH)